MRAQQIAPEWPGDGCCREPAEELPSLSIRWNRTVAAITNWWQKALQKAFSVKLEAVCPTL